MEDDVILELQGDNPLNLGEVPLDVSFLDLTTQSCRCGLTRTFDSIFNPQKKMKIFGVNGRGLLNFGFMQSNMTEPWSTFFPRHWWGSISRDLSFYKFLYTDNPAIINHSDLRNNVYGVYCLEESVFGGYTEIAQSHTYNIKDSLDAIEDSEIMKEYKQNLREKKYKIKTVEERRVLKEEKEK